MQIIVRFFLLLPFASCLVLELHRDFAIVQFEYVQCYDVRCVCTSIISINANNYFNQTIRIFCLSLYLFRFSNLTEDLKESQMSSFSLLLCGVVGAARVVALNAYSFVCVFFCVCVYVLN